MARLDLDTLKIPTFMRRKRVRVVSRHSPATALERKLAHRTRKPIRKVKSRPQTQQVAVTVYREPVVRSVISPRKVKVVKTVKSATSKRSAPKSVVVRKLKRPVVVLKKIQKVAKPIAEITHFYDQIKVAVLKLKGTLSVGDTIHIRGNATDFSQKIDSMQIDHENVDSAKKGDDVGLKLKKAARVGDQVFSLLQ